MEFLPIIFYMNQIPVGARYVGIPRTETDENPRGVMVEVFWEADESGELCISGHSAETPTPPNFQPVASLEAAARNFLGQRKPVHGIVLSHNENFTPPL